MNEDAARFREFLKTLPISDFGFAKTADGPAGFCDAVSIVVGLSDAVVNEIDGQPTYSYFHHYRTVNTSLDQMMLQIGLFLDSLGYRWLPVAASQSIPGEAGGFQGRYSHKKAACLAGLGTIGKNSLFLHNRFGSRVRLGTVFTDLELCGNSETPSDRCGGCTLCLKACPAMAISGSPFSPDGGRLVDPAACSRHMKGAYQLIGRGSVCGICMKVCPL